VPLAEETGFIVPLGRWVLEAACAAAMTWTEAGTEPSVAVNLSARQLQDPGLLADVRGALARSGLPGERLVLEITEGMLVGDQEKTVDVLHALKRMGISIAIDDFGTGYSSLSHLRKFPVDILKIDKSFVDQLVGAQAEGPAFVQAIIRLARELNVSTVAEGIEERAQQDALARMGCDVGQGFLLSRPLGERAAAELVVRAARGEAVFGGADIIGKTIELIEAAVSAAEVRTHVGPTA
jgi:diguanylate cyclase